MSDPLEAVREFYRAVLPDCEAFYRKCPLNEFWGGLNLQTMRRIIGGESSLEGVIHAAQRTLMFSVAEESKAQALAVAWLLGERRFRMANTVRRWHESASESSPSFVGFELEESKYTYLPLVVTYEEKRYTPDFLRCVNIAAEIHDYVGENLTTVELGAGLGHLARVMFLSEVSKRHILVDLPETLVLSYCFLRKNFPRARAILVDADVDRSLPIISTGEYEFLFVPVAYAEAALFGHKIDLFLNTASLGEMCNQTIRYWMDFVQKRLRPRCLFTLNRYLNTITPQLAWRREENECSVHYDADWQILKWELEPSFTRCPYVDTRISRYVEIIARCRPVSTVDVSAAQTALAAVRQEDWWRLRSQGHVMGMRDNPICVDGGMSGTLFKLWDALRLCPSGEVVGMMLAYLDRLCRSPVVEFEEVDYYRKLARLLMVSGK